MHLRFYCGSKCDDHPRCSNISLLEISMSFSIQLLYPEHLVTYVYQCKEEIDQKWNLPIDFRDALRPLAKCLTMIGTSAKNEQNEWMDNLTINVCLECWRICTHARCPIVINAIVIVVVATDATMPPFFTGRFFIHQFDEFTSDCLCFEHEHRQNVQNYRLRKKLCNWFSIQQRINTREIYCALTTTNLMIVSSSLSNWMKSRTLPTKSSRNFGSVAGLVNTSNDNLNPLIVSCDGIISNESRNK